MIETHQLATTLRANPSIIVFGLPRSGTTPLYLMIAQYFNFYSRGYIGLDEFLTVNGDSYTLVNDRLRIQRSLASIPVSEIPPDIYDSIIDYRYDLLKSIKQPVLVKIFPNQINEQQLDQISDKFTWIAIERIDLFDHLLSFLAAKSTGTWYRIESHQTIESKSLIARSDHIYQFIDYFTAFQKTVQRMSNRILRLRYEECDFNQPHRVLQKLKLPFDSSLAFELTYKQNIVDKTRYFLNLKEVTEIYRDSILNEFYPI